MTEIDTLSAALRLSDDPAPSDKRIICEVLREIGRDALARGDAGSLRKILEATHIAKRMARALAAHHA